MDTTELLLKDSVLASFAATHNIAQFISFSPSMKVRHIAIKEPESTFGWRLHDCVSAILLCSNAHVVNIRTFKPEQWQGNPFITNLTDPLEISQRVMDLTAQGYYTIIHEAIDVNDGGVSGVSENGFMEFSPGVTPRGVEGSKQPMCRLPEDTGKKILQSVYGINPEDIPDTHWGQRVEFSVHPCKVGLRQRNVITWEGHDTDRQVVTPRYVWPTAFSRLIGDKAFGLLLAYHMDIPVPKTIVTLKSGAIRPFMFGCFDNPQSSKTWTRTCPAEPVPGRFPTVQGDTPPNWLMQGHDVVSCLSQVEIPAVWSGGVVPTEYSSVIEGVSGFGDSYMQGTRSPEPLPGDVIAAVSHLYKRVCQLFGKVKIEWAVDSSMKVWLLQINQIEEVTEGKTIVPGDPVAWVEFSPAIGLTGLRLLLAGLPAQHGVLVTGNVGVASHIADVLRKAGVPARIQ